MTRSGQTDWPGLAGLRSFRLCQGSFSWLTLESVESDLRLKALQRVLAELASGDHTT
jgi:hypothetical protein